MDQEKGFFSLCNLGPLLNYLTTVWPSTFNWVIKGLCCHLVRLSVNEIGFLTLTLEKKEEESRPRQPYTTSRDYCFSWKIQQKTQLRSTGT